LQRGQGHDCAESPAWQVTKPQRPKLKPVDHWDLLAEFADARHRREDHDQRKAKQERMRAGLDGQLQERLVAKEREAEERQRIRDEIWQHAERDRKSLEAEQRQRQLKWEELNRARKDGEAAVALRRRQNKEHRLKEQHRVTDWLEAESERQCLEDEKANQEKLARQKAKLEELEVAYNARVRQRAAMREEEKTLVIQGGGLLSALGTLDGRPSRPGGASFVGPTAAQQAAAAKEEMLEQRFEKERLDLDRKADERDEREEREHKRKVREMMEFRAQQVRERNESGAEARQREADRQQLEIWRRQDEEKHAQDRRRAEEARRARKEIDSVVWKQMEDFMSVHPRNVGNTAKKRQQDVDMNRQALEQIAAEGGPRSAEATRILAQFPRRRNPSPNLQ